MESQPLFNVAFLAARWETESQDFQKSDKAQQLDIMEAETDANALTYKLYKLTDEEIRLVEEK